MLETYKQRLRKERGIVTLIISLTILLMVTIVTFISAEVAIWEQRVLSNEIRERQSFEAAQAAIDLALASLTDDGFDEDATQIVNPASPASLTNGATYAVELCKPGTVGAWPLTGTDTIPEDEDKPCDPATEKDRMLVYARGWSDDGIGLHKILVVIAPSPIAHAAPSLPLISRGVVNIPTGGPEIINEEGKSTVWTGGDINATGSATLKTQRLGPDGVTMVTSSSNKLDVASDVVANDPTLGSLTPDQFFEEFFGLTPEQWENSGATQTDSLSDPGDKAIWMNGDVDFPSGDIGSEDHPVVIVVDGNATMNGNTTIYGILYVRGNIDGTGTVDIYGSGIVEGQTNLTGNYTITFRGSIVEDAVGNGGWVILPGGWKDWVG